MLVWIVQGNNFFLYKVLAPRYEQARNETFKNSQSYNDGMAGELAQLQLDYVRAKSQEERDAIATLVLQRVASYDTSRLSSDLQEFVRQIKASRSEAK
jgi:hypothetical protein